MNSPKSDLRWNNQYRADGLLGASWMVFQVPKNCRQEIPKSECVCIYVCVFVGTDACMSEIAQAPLE